MSMKTILQIFTKREQQMIEYVALGYTAKQIAQRTGVEARTVHSYLGNVKRKLRARTLAQAVFLACRSGFI